ncbi:MAG: hypothetical protein K0R38_441 [Polyangiaceae bacterium]|jgi:hypothetical protein|nr:hypothetical protein [Polyangiaceae bacterium]
MKHLLAALLVSVPLFAACGGQKPPSNSQYELDKKHCTGNSECASGLCANGRCG